VVRVRNGGRALLLVVCRTVAEQEKAQAQKQMHVASERTVVEQMNRLSTEERHHRRPTRDSGKEGGRAFGGKLEK